MKRTVKWTAISLGSLFLLLLLAGTPLGSILTALTLGWYSVLQRKLPVITVNWSVIGMAILCATLAVLFGHRLVGSLLAQIQSGRSSSLGIRWRWQWTLSALGTLVVLFTVAMGSAGVFRHVSWLLACKEPWIADRGRVDTDYVDAQRVLSIAIADRTSVSNAQAAFLKSPSRRANHSLVCERYSAILFGDSEAHLTAFVLIRRDSTQKGVLVIDSERNDLPDLHPLAKLPEIVAQLQEKYPTRSQH
jgi:hypothetical protein